MPNEKSTHAARVAGKNGFSLISDETFRALYAALLRCRMLDERMSAGNGYERWTGREAGAAGVIACLRPGDSVTPTPRGLLAGYLQNGSLVPPRRDAPATAQLAAATGDALRHKLEQLGNISVVFTSIAEPDRDGDRTRRIFAAAASQSLPVFYVLEGNALLAEVGAGIPVIRVDGSDAVAVYRVAHESITRAREGGGPTVMECAVWPDDGEPRDPLLKLEHYLAGKKLFRQDWKQRLEKKYSQTVDAAIKAANLI